MRHHSIIVHAYTPDRDGDHYLDDPVPVGTEVRWTAWERIVDRVGGDIQNPWEVDSQFYDEVVKLARERIREVGLTMDDLFIEHDPSDVYL